MENEKFVTQSPHPDTHSRAMGSIATWMEGAAPGKFPVPPARTGERDGCPVYCRFLHGVHAMNARLFRPRRSFLFVPGSNLALFPKAVHSRADIVCVDLEDAVAPDDKARARENTVKMLDQSPSFGQSEVLVRVNSLRSRDGMADVLALLECTAPPDGLMLPKVKHPEEIRALDDLLTAEGSDLRLQVIIETNPGLECCHEIARASCRVDSLLFGGVDMAAELRVEPTWEGLHYARMRCVHAAAAAEIDMIDVPYLDLDNLDGLAKEAALCAQIGMTGKGAIHPRQLPVIVKAFTPSADQIAHARKIVQAFESAGTGLVVVDNKLIEKPVLRSMYRILSLVETMDIDG